MRHVVRSYAAGAAISKREAGQVVISEVLAGTRTGKCRVRQADGCTRKHRLRHKEKYQLPVPERVTANTNEQLSGGKTAITS